MRLLFIRHGETSSNVGHHLDTAPPGADLTDMGRRQAAAIPSVLADAGIQAIYTSTLVRTQQTAAPLADVLGLRPVVRAGLREISAGDYEMANDVESIRAYVETAFGWGEDPARRLPGGETAYEVLERVDSVLAEAHATGVETVAMFAHGAVIRVWSALRASNVDMEYAARTWLPNTAMVVLEGDPEEGWTMTQWTEHALGGSSLDDEVNTGPAGEPEDEILEDLASPTA